VLKKTVFTTFAVAALSLAASSFAFAQTETDMTTPEAAAPAQGQYANVNGINLYYETRGSGQPLIVLHGGLGSTMMFDAVAPALAETHQVIAVDLQGHGRTEDIDRPMTYEDMADDIAALVTELELGQVDIMGYSLGGGVALQTAIRHPEVVRKLVLVSTPYSRSNWYPEVLMGMGMMTADSANQMIETPMYQLYAAVAPNVDDWAQVVGKVGTLLGQDYDWSAEIEALSIPALLIYGDADSISPARAAEMYALFGGGQSDGGSVGIPESQLAILPNTIHWSILSRADLIVPLVTSFLQ
jgi:pimeloyl-ACP methyl ester carboxylesterase